MKRYADITAMAAEAFAQHRFTREAGYCWRLGQPGRSFYAFRIGWMPGALIITGDLGEAVWHGPSDLWISPWESARFVSGCNADYLFGKTGGTEVFDPDATIANILRCADDQLRHGDRSIWEHLCDHYGFDASRVVDHMKAAACLRDGGIVEPGCTWRLGLDTELNAYAPPPSAQWHYEALQLWARHMIASEPLTSHAARAWRRVRTAWRDLRRYPILWQPDLYRRHRHWDRAARWRLSADGRWLLLRPATVFGRDLSRWGFWRDQGSSSPASAAAEFVRVADEAAAVREVAA